MTTYLLIQIEVGRVDEAAAILRAAAPSVSMDVVGGAFDIIARTQDHAAEAQIVGRCAGRPFIRTLPCRSSSFLDVGDSGIREP